MGLGSRTHCCDFAFTWGYSTSLKSLLVFEELVVRCRNCPYTNAIDVGCTRIGPFQYHGFYSHRTKPDGDYLRNFGDRKFVFGVVYCVQLIPQSVNEFEYTRHLASGKSRLAVSTACSQTESIPSRAQRWSTRRVKGLEGVNFVDYQCARTRPARGIHPCASFDTLPERTCLAIR